MAADVKVRVNQRSAIAEGQADIAHACNRLCHRLRAIRRLRIRGKRGGLSGKTVQSRAFRRHAPWFNGHHVVTMDTGQKLRMSRYQHEAFLRLMPIRDVKQDE